MKVTAKGSIIIVEYNEPSTNADGSALTDFSHTTIYMDGMTSKDVTASAPGGGGVIVEMIDSGVPQGAEEIRSIHITAWDTSGNESAPGPEMTVRVDTLAPASPF